MQWGSILSDEECSCCKSGHGGHDQELVHLREELKKATQALSEAMNPDSSIDFGAESPLSLFIQCFKEKYGLVVNPNDVAIFV